MTLPEDPEAREMFITLFRAAASMERFQPVELMKQFGYQNSDIIAQVEVLSLFQRYCTVWGPNDWQMRPMVISKYRNGYYAQFGILG